ncbi:cytochrome c family protein [Caballeronia terrestris]|uniref:Cytochrome c family protein n=4 Tax=Burkholderiaceae TaxID=119060 RepID=A0A158FCP0_9BURK|nr:cytochrome c family protein [Caballeronia choica]SAL64011.1 cytochrome c family protein [Caballeronia humi]SAL85295.1 cytochrome c family protein [Caballeronia terrestris]
MNRPNMRHLLHVLGIVTTLLGGVGCAFAEGEPTALLDRYRCMFCHTVDTPFRAPSFREIAAHYHRVPDASAMLEGKLRLGGRAHWGDMAMPSAAGRGAGALSREDAHVLVQWVLRQ